MILFFDLSRKRRTADAMAFVFNWGEGAQMLINNGLEEFGGVGGALVFWDRQSHIKPIKMIVRSFYKIWWLV